MDVRSVDRFGPSEHQFEAESSDEEDYNNQYDDFKDLFSNETESTADDLESSEIGLYLETDPGLQKEVAQLIMLRRHLDILQEKMSEREFAVVRAREELNACRTRLKALKSELDSVIEEVSDSEKSGNKAAYFRLISQKQKLENEIQADNELELDIHKTLQEAELCLSQIVIEQRHFTNLAEQVTEKEERVTQHKFKMAKYRLGKEQEADRKQKKKFKNANRNLEELIETRKMRGEYARQAAISNHIPATKFLKESLAKVQDKERKLEELNHIQTQQKVQTILSLKKNISSNRENLRALQARDAAYALEKKVLEENERKKVFEEGGNPDQVLLRRKKLQEFEKHKQEFAAKQESNKAQILSKILNEEQNISRRKKQQPHLFKNTKSASFKQTLPIQKPSIHSKIYLDNDDKPIFIEQEKYLPKPSQHEKRREILSASTCSQNEDKRAITMNKKHDLNGDDESLSFPEFEGLWEQKDKVYKAAKEEVQLKPLGGTKMEQQILQNTLNKHREGIIVKQIAAGREFKGQPFYSKPDTVHFKNLEVGKSYKKKIVITNVSYSINFLKLTGMSEHLKDFIKIEFHPPGQMSAGMSCEMNVTFKPMINKDLSGEVFFTAQTGPFSIPLICSTKKCDLSLDLTSIDFGVQVVGETIRKSVTLINKGALGTRFEFQKIPDREPTLFTLETSLGRLTTADTVAPTPNDVSELPKTSTTIFPESKQSVQTTDQPAEFPKTADTTMEITVEPERDESEQYFDQGTGEDNITFETPATEYPTMPEEIKVGEICSGEIEAFSSLKLVIVFSPSMPGDIQANFKVVFTDQNSDALEVHTKAVAIDVPVWLDRQNIDLKITMYDRLYQDQIQIHNRASTALRLNFEVPKELRNHMELLPKTGYIQAKSTFTAQLKFLPGHTLQKDAGSLFDAETGVLECPLVVRVADQTRPVPFVVNAIVTSSDMHFDQTDIDFGHCGIYESVTQTVKLTNHSILPQLFGFVNIPDYVDVQPNDGFGTILPLETLELDIIVQAKRAKEYDFTLTCRSGINRDFFIKCKAVGVHPPLELSHQVVHFAASALDDVAVTNIHVINPHTSANEFTHPVPRIGKGEIVPVGPTSFEFVIPENAPISLTPSVGTILPGKKCHITLEFSPKLKDSDIRKEAVNVFIKEREEKSKEEEKLRRKEEQELANKQLEEEKTKGKKTPKTPAKSKPVESVARSSKSSAKTNDHSVVDEPLPTPEMIDENSTAYKSAKSSLMRNFPGTFESFVIPCFVAVGKCSDSVEPSSLPYSKMNTLYLQVHCPTIKPPVVIISNHGHNLTDFGQVSIGQNAIRPISIQNISDHPVELTVSVLDTSGPFQLLNALRTLKPEETHTMLVSFTPHAGTVFYEVLKMISPTSTLEVCLTGRGVTPVIKLTPDSGVIDMGHVMKDSVAETQFQLENQSSLAVKYSIRLDSRSLLKHNYMQQLPEFMSSQEKNRKTLQGPQNDQGSSVFDCTPCEGEIKTGENHSITVTFKPDRAGVHYSDGIGVVLFNTEKTHVINVIGKCDDRMMYIEGSDPLDVNVESLANVSITNNTEQILPTENIALSFTSHVTNNGFSTAERILNIGCLRSLTNVAKKNGEWIVDNIQTATALGFQVDQPKGNVELDSMKPLSFTWTPPENQDPSVPVMTSILLTLKADVVLSYNVILSGLITFN